MVWLVAGFLHKFSGWIVSALGLATIGLGLYLPATNASTLLQALFFAWVGVFVVVSFVLGIWDIHNCRQPVCVSEVPWVTDFCKYNKLGETCTQCNPR